MLNAKTFGTVHTQVVLNNIFLKIFKKRNKDPCYIGRLFYLRI